MAFCQGCGEEYLYFAAVVGIEGEHWSNQPDWCPTCLETGRCPHVLDKAVWGVGKRRRNNGHNYKNRAPQPINK